MIQSTRRLPRILGNGFDNSRKVARYSFLMLSVVSLISSSFTNGDAYAIEGCNPTMTTKIDQFYQGPVFVDAYWTESSSSFSTSTSGTLERELGPGEGRATLAVVLVNRNLLDISAIVGFLQLPEGFESAGTSIYPESRTVSSASGNRLGFNEAAVASFDSIVTAKSSFTLYFDINVLDNAKVGTQLTQLVMQYYLSDQPGLCTSALIKFPLVLSGKTILDVTTDGSYLVPKTPNTVNISIVNKGTADATGVVAAIVGLGESGTRSQNNADGSVLLQSSDTELINLGEKVFNIGTIRAGSGVKVSTVIFPSKDAAGTVQNMNIQLLYGNAYGNAQNIVIGTGLVILPNPMDASVGITYDDTSDSHILTAEKLQDLNFIVTNNSPSSLSDVVFSITPQSTSVTIVGDSKWTILSLESGERQKVSTKVIAAKSMIGSPTSFTVSLTYIIKDEEKTDSLNLGAFVTGEINVQIYDLSVNYVGNTPNLVGNILNQGNTAALYTSAQLLPSENLATAQMQTEQNSDEIDASAFASDDDRPVLPPQYVGDISADSSIPFSIPLKSDSLKPGINQVALKIVYADNLKNFHEVVLNSQVNFEQRALTDSERTRDASLLDFAQNPAIPIIALASIIAAIVIIRRKKNTNLKQLDDHSKFESDIESLLDEHSKGKLEDKK